MEHVQAYNADWNYYADDFEETEEHETKKSRMHFRGYRSKVNYQFGREMRDEFEFFGEYADNFSSRREGRFSAKEREFLEILELEAGDISVSLLKKQYKKLAKTYHPDMHRNDKKAEEKFKQINIAYKTLLEKLSCAKG